MNIQTLSAYQRGTFNEVLNRWEGVNLFAQYVQFCQRRRSYPASKVKV